MTWTQAKNQILSAALGAMLASAGWAVTIRDDLQQIRTELRQVRRDLCFASYRALPNCTQSLTRGQVAE